MVWEAAPLNTLRHFKSKKRYYFRQCWVSKIAVVVLGEIIFSLASVFVFREFLIRNPRHLICLWTPLRLVTWLSRGLFSSSCRCGGCKNIVNLRGLFFDFRIATVRGKRTNGDGVVRGDAWSTSRKCPSCNDVRENNRIANPPYCFVGNVCVRPRCRKVGYRKRGWPSDSVNNSGRFYASDRQSTSWRGAWSCTGRHACDIEPPDVRRISPECKLNLMKAGGGWTYVPTWKTPPRSRRRASSRRSPHIFSRLLISCCVRSLHNS